MKDILADPVSKESVTYDHFRCVDGVLDARVFLKNTYGYNEWAEGQVEYEKLVEDDKTSIEVYRAEIEYDRPTYEHYSLRGRVLDCGGGSGIVREFLSDDVEFVSTDPWLHAPFANSAARKVAYSCLNRPLNFIAATAEFQPFLAESFDWVHMRSMLDHVQVPDLALIEARRVLKNGGRVLIGLYVEGGKDGVIPFKQRVKESVKKALSFIGIDRWKDHHVWHPTYRGLVKLISENGLEIEDTYWQPHFKNYVCYVCARKSL